MSAEHPIDRAARIVGDRVALARLCDVTPAAVGNWKQRGIPVHYCVRIEVATAGAVTRQEMRPDDWKQIWPELADQQPNQPPAKASQAPEAIKYEVNGEGTHV